MSLIPPISARALFCFLSLLPRPARLLARSLAPSLSRSRSRAASRPRTEHALPISFSTIPPYSFSLFDLPTHSHLHALYC